MNKHLHFLEKALIKFQWIILYIFHNQEFQNNLVKNILNIKVIIYPKFQK